jgi:hypothetical protein
MFGLASTRSQTGAAAAATPGKIARVLNSRQSSGVHSNSLRIVRASSWFRTFYIRPPALVPGSLRSYFIPFLRTHPKSWPFRMRAINEGVIAVSFVLEISRLMITGFVNFPHPLPCRAEPGSYKVSRGSGRKGQGPSGRSAQK